ncbi:MAG: Uma2 family endonuclease [Sphingomonas taxi]
MLATGELQPFRLRIEDYELLDRSGAFATQRVELIEGVVVEVNSEWLPHSRLKNELMFRLRLCLRDIGSPFDAYVETSLSLPPHNMPDADVVVADAGASGKYLGANDVAIVIEVAASSLRGDLGVKKRLYAEHVIPEYWVADVNGREVHQFWMPEGGDYRHARCVPLAGPLASATLPGLVVDGTGIL